MSKKKEFISRRELARRHDWYPSYVMRLCKAELAAAVTQDNKIDAQLAEEILAGLEHPEKYATKERHAVSRAGRNQNTPTSANESRSTRKSKTRLQGVVDDPGQVVSTMPAQGAGTSLPRPDSQQQVQQNSSPDQGTAAGSMTRTYAHEKAEHAKIDTELKRLKLLEAAGDLVKAVDVRAAVLTLCGDIRDKLLALPDRLHNQLAAETEPNAVHALLDQEVRKTLDELANDDTGARRIADRISAGQRQ